MVADFPEAAAGSPEGVVVEVVIQETGTEAEADVSPAAVFREEAIVVVITVVETAAAGSNAETAAVATLPETAVATLPETTAAVEKAVTPPPALDPTGPCNNAAAASDKTRKSHRQKKEEEERERQKDRYKTRVD